MDIVAPDTITTLLFNRQTYLPFMVVAARAAFKNMLNGRGVGIGPEGAHYGFKEILEGNVLTFADQPLLRSAHRAWPIPTMITIDPNKFFSHRRGKLDNNMPSVRTVFDYFKGECQYCGKKVRWNEVNRNEAASREHIVAVKHCGPSTRNNLLLMHAKCNAFLGHRENKTDINGVPLKEGMKPSPSHFMLPHGMKPRKEWLRMAPWLAEPVATLDLT